MDTYKLKIDTVQNEISSFLDLDATFREKSIIVAFVFFILTMLIISGWSAILYLHGNAGGGPLGMIVNALQIEHVLS